MCVRRIKNICVQLLPPLPPGGVGGFPLNVAPAAPAEAVADADAVADAVGVELDAMSGAASLASACGTHKDGKFDSRNSRRFGIKKWYEKTKED